MKISPVDASKAIPKGALSRAKKAVPSAKPALHAPLRPPTSSAAKPVVVSTRTSREPMESAT